MGRRMALTGTSQNVLNGGHSVKNALVTLRSGKNGLREGKTGNANDMTQDQNQ